jgi:restriction system protein
MAIPDYQTLMLPLLQLLNDGQEHLLREAVQELANKFNLTDEERSQLLPSGVSTIIGNRVGWARTYLQKAGLIESRKRGCLQLSSRGRSVLKGSPLKIDVEFLRRYPEFIDFQSSKRNKESIQIESLPSTEATPEEALDLAYQKLRSDLEAELLERMKSLPPSFFERLVIDVLVKMGYGGSREDAGKAVGRSGDGGIDGIIKEDRLGLDTIYIQAKRWDGSVGRPEIQRFAGALQGNRARKGVFITTSTFTKEAEEFVMTIDTKIVLIKGTQLAKLMIDLNVGISTVTSYEIKKIDSDYFDVE